MKIITIKLKIDNAHQYSEKILRFLLLKKFRSTFIEKNPVTREEDVEIWLKPFCELGISDLSISDDSFHYEEEKDNPDKRALAVAKRLGLPADSICIEKPTVEIGINKEQDKGAPVIGGGAMFRGRAVEKLVEGLLRRRWEEFKERSIY